MSLAQRDRQNDMNENGLYIGLLSGTPSGKGLALAVGSRETGEREGGAGVEDGGDVGDVGDVRKEEKEQTEQEDT